MSEPAVFDARDRRTLVNAMTSAEELTGRFYCIPGREWPRYPYELKTRAEGRVPAAPALADVVRLVARRSGPAPAAYREMYRIRLRDDAILSAVRDPDDGIDLYPLLLYVLTHELVHVVRFGSGAARFHSRIQSRRLEEARVRAITRIVLKPADDPGLRRVIEVYGRGPEEAALGDCASPK